MFVGCELGIAMVLVEGDPDGNSVGLLEGDADGDADGEVVGDTVGLGVGAQLWTMQKLLFLKLQRSNNTS